MMKLIFLVTMILCINVHVVFGERMIRFTFNDGVPPLLLLNECTAADFRHIDPLFNITTSTTKHHRRNLRRSASTSPSVMVYEPEMEHRDLKSYPGRCKNYCAGMARGTCRATGCVGFRRQLQESELSCDAHVNSIHDALDALILAKGGKLLSLPCQRFLKRSKRKTNCVDDVVYGEITGFTFITSTTQLKVLFLTTPPIITAFQQNAQSGYTFCNSVPFNIAIGVNPCVDVVNMTLTGPNNFVHSRIDSHHPMTLFKNTTTTSGTGLLQSTYPDGIQYLNPGAYTLRATPDNFLHKEKTLTFRIKAC
jgi:hypothetical protein